jgi:hypothetical protein
MPTTNSADRSSRVELAEELLRESVYRSRAAQAARTVLAQGASTATGERNAAAPGAASASGNCGLGEKAAVVLDLSPRGREIFERLFPIAGDDVCARFRACAREWIEAQDAIDRKRNHFLKAFRREHGADRTQYSAAQLAEFETGLARVNGEEDRERRSAAERLLGD